MYKELGCNSKAAGVSRRHKAAFEVLRHGSSFLRPKLRSAIFFGEAVSGSPVWTMGAGPTVEGRGARFYGRQERRVGGPHFKAHPVLRRQYDQPPHSGAPRRVSACR